MHTRLQSGMAVLESACVFREHCTHFNQRFPLCVYFQQYKSQRLASLLHLICECWGKMMGTPEDTGGWRQEGIESQWASSVPKGWREERARFVEWEEGMENLRVYFIQAILFEYCFSHLFCQSPSSRETLVTSRGFTRGP